MTISYSVGAVFRIVDEASSVLKGLSIQFKDLDGLIDAAKESLSAFSSTRFAGLTTRIGNVDKALASIGTTADASTAAIASGFAKLDASAVTSLDTLRGVKAEMAEIALASKGMAVIPVSGGGGRRPGGGGGAGSISGGSVGIPGARVSLGGGVALGAAAAVGYSIVEASQIEKDALQLIYHTAMEPTAENKKKLYDIIQSGAAATGYSMKDVAAAATDEARLFRGTPGNGVSIMPDMLKIAATEAILKGSSLEESMTAFIGLAHMTKAYTPEAIAKLAPAFAFLSASNPSSLGSMEKAAGYAVPILQSGLSIDPEKTLMLGTVLTRAGITNTKSGTWLRNMVLGAMPGTSIMSKMAFEKHEESLKALGLVDDDDKPTWFTDGKPDPLKMLDIASAHAAAIPMDKRAGYEKQLFGAQGYGGFSVLADPAVKAQIAELMAEMNGPEFHNRYSTFLQNYGQNSTSMMASQTLADVNNMLADMGTTLLPVVKLALGGIKDIVFAIRDAGNDPGIKAIIGAFQSLGRSASSAAAGVAGLADSLRSVPGGALPAPAGDTGRLGAPFNHLAPPPVPRLVGPGLGKQSMNDAPTHIKTAIYLDGNVLAEAVASVMARDSTHPTQAGYFDTGSMAVGGDWAMG